MQPKRLPVIGISANIAKDADGMLPGYRRSYVNEDYIAAIIQNGGVPILLPVNEKEDVLKQQVSLLDGLILSGGSDISPLEYGEEPDVLLGEIIPERDYSDMKILQFAIEKKIPILGICRGLQLLNVYHGGTLYQDNRYHHQEVYKHWQGHGPDIATHHVSLEKDSILYHAYQKENICVNSFHHQSIKKLGDGLKKIAKSKDGIIEGIESTYYPFMVGTQWHPEMLFRKDEGANALFKLFLTEASKGGTL